MPLRLGPWEIGLILVLVLIVFGVGALPQISGAIGKGLRAFREGRQGEGAGEEELESPRSGKAAHEEAVDSQALDLSQRWDVAR